MSVETPTAIQIESSTECGARCVYCPHTTMKRKSGEMTTDLFRKILSETKELGISDISLFLNGEPLMFPRLFDWLELLRSCGMRTKLSTNGAHMTEEKARRVLSYSDVIDEVVFSLGGIDRQTYRDVMGLDFSLVHGNVKVFASLNHGRIRTSATVPLHSWTRRFMNTWGLVWMPFIGPKLSFSRLFNFAGKISDECVMGPRNGLKTKYCARLHHMVVFWDGRVPLCSMDFDGEIIIGSAKTDGILDIYNGRIPRHYRDYHRDGKWKDLPLCKECNANASNL